MRRCAGALVAALLAGAAGVQTACAQALDVRGLWRIDQAQSEPLLDRSLARLDFGADGQLTGHTGCKPMIATYRLEGTTLQVGPVRTGTARCTRLQLEQEDRVLTALEHAASARVRPDGLLELRDADGRGVLRGTRFDPIP